MLLKNTASVALKSASAKSQARTGMKAKLTKYTYVNGVGQRSLSASVALESYQQPTHWMPLPELPAE